MDARKQFDEQIGAAARNVDQGAFFAQPHSRSYGQYQAKRFGNEGPNAEEPPDDEATQHSLDLGYTTVLGVNRVRLDEHSC